MNGEILENKIKQYMDLKKMFYNLNISEDNLFLEFVLYEPYKTFFIIDIAFKNQSEKREIYKNIIQILKEFSFTFTLEFYNLEELREWNL